MKENLVLVLLLNYNQVDYTIKCVESILESNYDNFFVIVLDNGSKRENVKELMSNLPSDERLIFEKIDYNIGYSKGINHGLNIGLKFNPDFYLIMNNDTIIDKGAIKALVDTSISYNKKALVIGKVYQYNEPNKFEMVGYGYKNKNLLKYYKLGENQIDEGQFDKEEERVMVDDVYILHPVEVYKLTGGYTPHLFINGVNVDLGLRAQKLGYKLIYTPKAKLWHKGSASIGGRSMNPKLVYWDIESSLILRYLHLNKINFTIFYFSVIESISRTFLKSKFNRFFKSDSSLERYSKAKIKALFAFHKWQFKKNESTGYNPF